MKPGRGEALGKKKGYWTRCNLLSKPLRGELALQTHFDAIKNVYFFRQCSRPFLIEVSEALESEARRRSGQKSKLLPSFRKAARSSIHAQACGAGHSFLCV